MSLPLQLGKIYTIGDEIGSGSFSTVHLCRNKSTTEEYVVKIIQKWDGHSLNEVEILKTLCHNNIIKYIDDEDTVEEKFIITEYVKGETLHQRMCRQQFSEHDSAFIMTNLMKALSYLHNLKIVHRDISTKNIFIGFSGDSISTLKLGDFGIAAKLLDGIQVGYNGTNGFLAPEIKQPYFRGILPVYNTKIDIFSAGIILVCLFLPSEAFIMVLVMDIVTIFAAIIPHPAVRELALRMTEENPIKRHSADDVLDHHWIRRHSTN